MEKKELELYLHIPFCIQKCLYCDFLSMPAEDSFRRQYVDRLLEEIRTRAGDYRDYTVTSIFFGGGTPSILPGVQTAELMEAIGEHFSIDRDAEITMECNPGTLNREKLIFYRNAGINRLSMGLQSAQDDELRRLGRIHTYEEFLRNYDLARKKRFDNINIDIMSGLPGQDMEDWESTLRKAAGLRPEHISAYSLIIEAGTPFFDLYGADELRREQGKTPQYLPDEETERAMYEMTKSILAEKGYIRYEISNYARHGKECRHNIGYWIRKPYLGLGLGSSSLIDNVRFSNTGNWEEYFRKDFKSLAEIKNQGQNVPEISEKALEKEKEVVCLEKKQQIEEFMFLGLRMMQGVSRTDFKENFQVEIDAFYGDVIRRMTEQGLLEQNAGRIYLTEEGISVSNYVMSEFLLGDDE